MPRRDAHRLVRLFGALLLVALVWAFAAAPAGADEIRQEYWGRNVTKVTYDVPPWLKLSEIERTAKVKEGKALSRWRVRSTITRVFLLGYVDNVVIKAKPSGPDGVAVEVKVYPTYVLREIDVRGNSSLNYNEIVDDALGIQQGDDFRLEDLPVWEEKIRQAYTDVGHLKATVKIEYEKTKLEADNKVDLRITVNERPTFHVTKIELIGDLGLYSRDKILRKLGWSEGMEYERERVEDGVERLRNYLKGRKHYEAAVGDIDLEDDETVNIDVDHSEITFLLDVDVGPKIKIDYGEECVSCAEKKWKLDDHLDVTNNRRFTKWLIDPYRENIENYYKSRGYLDVRVAGDYYEEIDEEGWPTKVLAFQVDKGRKYKVKEIDFKNNPSFSDDELRDRMEAGKYFLQEDFDKNLENVINFYNRNGFLDAKILQKSAEIDEGRGEIFIEIVVSEGPRTKVSKVELIGNEVLGDDRFQNMLNQADLVPGRAYNPFNVGETRTRMIAKYLTRGYIKARIREEVKISEDRRHASITYNFIEGEQYFFGEVYIHGNKLTKKHVISRELFITTGDPFNYEDVFESQQQLMKLGFFSSVNITQVNPEIEEKDIDLLVTVNERNSGYIETGLKYDTYSAFTAAWEIGHKNLAGHGRKLSFRTDVSFGAERFAEQDEKDDIGASLLRFDQRTAALNFVWPWVGRLPMDGELTLKDALTHQIGYDLRELSMEAGLKVELPKLFYFMDATRHNEAIRWAAKYWTGRLTYAFIRDFLFNVDETAVDEQSGEIQIATLTPQVIRDSRDNPFNPATGKVYMAALEWGSPPLLSQIAYLKSTGQVSWYEPAFRWWGATNGPVLAFNVKASHLQELRDTDTVPINRRLYLGGSTTIRGFGQDEISPVGDDGRTPIGGYFSAYSNVEIRTPIDDTSFGLLFFWDVGNVTDSFETWYIDKARTTTGMGFRYLTPVGPISADYGIKLNREPDESFGEFYITVGNAF
ncbi:BamA/TamA family outer membrane protein [bacterium]|nr:BamA/TamA family outer membrane protein [bacterium]